MSGFAVIVNFDGKPVAPAEIARMTDAMAYRGPDGISHLVDGAVALGHCMLHTTAESLEETQPLRSDDGALVLVMDGYLTNWEELRAELGAKGARLRTRSDAELILRAYEHWGEDCVPHIEGEYAFVIWDGRRKQAFCVRDNAGLRPLHFAWNDRRLTVATDIAGVLADHEVPRRPNYGMVAEVSANQWFSLTETLWLDVNRIEPAQWMCVSAAGVRTGRHWAPPLGARTRYAREEEYFEHYREVLQDSIRRASRTHLPLGCEVSGGLDSSAIFCVADRMIKSGQLLAPDLKGYTYRFDQPGPADEVRYARAVAAHTGRPVREVAPFLPDLAWFAQRGRDDLDMAPYPNGAMAVNIGQAATGDGCRVVLNGEGGDEFMTGRPSHYHEDLMHRDWAAVARSLRADTRDLGPLGALRRFARFGIAPMAPRSIRAFGHRLLANRGGEDDANVFWLSQELQDTLARRREQIDQNRYAAVTNLPLRLLAMSLDDAFVVSVRDAMSRQSARGHYQLRTPMYSRRFIDFMFAVPEHMRLRGAAKKYIHVQALSGWLPDIVARRSDKADFMTAFERLIDGMEHYFTDQLPSRSPNIFDKMGMAKLYRNYREGGANTKPSWELWGCFSSENMLGPWQMG